MFHLNLGGLVKLILISNFSFSMCAGWWMNSNNVQWGAFTVVGYLLYRFSQSQWLRKTFT